MKTLIFSLILFCASVTCVQAQKPAISKEVLNNLIRSIPSPLQLSVSIKEFGIAYDNNVLTSLAYAQKVQTPFQQAFLLGVLSTDIEYANIYGQVDASLASLKACEEISKVMKINKVIDFADLEVVLKQKPGDLDALLELTTLQLENINNHLQKNDKQGLVVVMLVSGWVKSLYIMCDIDVKNPNGILKERISEQKTIMEQLGVLLSFFEEDKEISSLIQKMNELNKIYADVKALPTIVDIQKIHQITKEILQNSLEGK